MEFYEVINKRRSIRQFEDREIPRDVLERILDAGLKAPSSNHQRRWELVTLTEKTLILDLAQFIRPYPCRVQEPKTPQQEMFKIAYPRQRTMIEESACVILPYFKQITAQPGRSSKICCCPPWWCWAMPSKPRFCRPRSKPRWRIKFAGTSGKMGGW